jgi:hypothetical protein
MKIRTYIMKRRNREKISVRVRRTVHGTDGKNNPKIGS